jgi:hypothetical protein
MKKLALTISIAALFCSCCATRPTVAIDRNTETRETSRDTIVVHERIVSGTVVKPADTTIIDIPVIVENGVIVPSSTVTASGSTAVKVAVDSDGIRVETISREWRGRYDVVVADTARQSIIERHSTTSERVVVTEQVKYTPWLVRVFFWIGLIFTAFYTIKYGLRAYTWVLRHK